MSRDMDYTEYEEENNIRVIEMLEMDGSFGDDPHSTELDRVAASFDPDNPLHIKIYDAEMYKEYKIYLNEAPEIN